MGRASSAKSVARAQRAAARRPSTSGGRSWLWPAGLALVVLLGVGLVVVSRGTEAASTPPLVGDHWHAAYGINLCGQWQPPLQDAGAARSGIHTHGDGLIHLHPHSTRFTGEGASLGAWAEAVDMELEADRLVLPDGRTLEDGDDCGGQPGEVRVRVWDGPGAGEGRLIEGDPAAYAPQDGEVVAIGFLPEGEQLEQPPTAARLQDPTAAEQGRPLSPLPGEQAPAPEEPTDTTAPAPPTTTSP